MQFRSFLPSDLPTGLLLCRAAGWNQVDDDWKFFITHEACKTIVAVDNSGTIIGSATTVSYIKFFWIGMVLVHPDHRRNGVGTALLKRAIAAPQGTPRLDATPAGREVYLRLGFTDEYHLTRMQRHPAHVPPASEQGNIRQMTREDVTQLSEFDLDAFGGNRQALLQSLLVREDANCLVASKDGSILGYGFSRAGYQYDYIGPLIGAEDACRAILVGILCANPTAAFLIDIPDNQIGWREWLVTIGFTEQRPFVRMYLGDAPPRGNPSVIFGIAGPEFG